MEPTEGVHRSVRSERFIFAETALHGVWRVQRTRSQDERGEFSRLFCGAEFAAIGIADLPKQANYSRTSRRGTVRGLHFQYPPHAETKIVTCLTGRIFDILLDLRQGSPTFRQWAAFELSGETLGSLVIPPGVAHGFQTLEDGCQLIYFHSEMFAGQAEGGVSLLDPGLLPGPIALPLEITLMSERDRGFPTLAEGFAGLSL